MDYKKLKEVAESMPCKLHWDMLPKSKGKKYAYVWSTDRCLRWILWQMQTVLPRDEDKQALWEYIIFNGYIVYQGKGYWCGVSRVKRLPHAFVRKDGQKKDAEALYELIQKGV